MKADITFLFFGILAVTNAATINYEGAVEVLIKEAQNISIQAGELLELQYKAIVVEPINEVDIAIQKIEDLRKEDADCVAAKDPDVELVVDTLHEDMNTCGTIAAKKSATIMIDINAAMQQLVFDGYKILKLYQKCKNYKNSILKSSCYTKLTIQTTLYMKNARKSIKTIKEVNQRIPTVFTEADICTHNSSNKAVLKLDFIHTEVDSCIKSNI